MKVISKGGCWTVNKQCKGCKAILEADETDLQYEVTDEDTTAQQYLNEIEGSFYIECPECGQRLKILGKNIPEKIKERIKGE